MVYVFLADGFEETEALCPADILRRGGCDVTLVGVGDDIIRGSHGISVCADIADSMLTIGDETEMVVLPGGMPGTLNLEKNANVKNAVKFCAEKGKYIAAICAAPSILGHMGLLKDRRAICFPGFESQLDCKKLSEDLVCEDGNIITAKGMGVALDFGVKLLEKLKGVQTAQKVKDSLQCR